MLQNGQFRLRMAGEVDLPFITKVRTSEHVQQNVGIVLFANEERQKQWLQRVSNDSSQLYAIFEKQEGDHWIPLGYTRLTEIDYKNRNMCVGGDIAEEHAGKGYGRELYKLILRLGFDTWSMHRLWLLVLEKNERARKLYAKMGFVEEGMRREAIFKNGKYENYVLMSILEEEYRRQHDTAV